MVDVTVDVQLTLRAEYDAEMTGLDKVKYDALLEGIKINNPNLARDVRSALERYLHRELGGNVIGWIDENVSYGFTDILDVTVIKIVEVKAAD
jgi:hypothetical protein